MAVPVPEQAADAVAKLAWVHDVLGSVSTDEYARLTSAGQREAASSPARLKARVTAHELAAVEKSGAARRQGAHLCELLPTDELPVTNNTGIVLTVSIDHESLLDRLRTATLSTGERISAGEARRLA